MPNSSLPPDRQTFYVSYFANLSQTKQAAKDYLKRCKDTGWNFDYKISAMQDDAGNITALVVERVNKIKETEKAKDSDESQEELTL